MDDAVNWDSLLNNSNNPPMIQKEQAEKPVPVTVILPEIKAVEKEFKFYYRKYRFKSFEPSPVGGWGTLIYESEYDILTLNREEYDALMTTIKLINKHYFNSYFAKD